MRPGTLSYLISNDTRLLKELHCCKLSLILARVITIVIVFPTHRQGPMKAMMMWASATTGSAAGSKAFQSKCGAAAAPVKALHLYALAHCF